MDTMNSAIKENENSVTLNENFEITIKSSADFGMILNIIKDHLPNIENDYIVMCLNYIGTEWVNQNGKFLKRFKKYFKQNHSIVIDDNILSIIGEKIRSHDVDNTYHVEINRDFIWQDGDYNDTGSCFWSFNTHHRAIMASPLNFNIHAVKITGGEIGRCWLINDVQYGLIIFNSYGMQLKTIAKILSAYYHRTSSEQYFKIHDVYHNGGRAYILKNDINDDFVDSNYSLMSDRPYCPLCNTYFSRYDDVFNSDDDGRFGCNACIAGYTCSHCGDSINEYDAYYNDSGEMFCDSCFCDLYAYCENCGDIVYIDDVKTADSVTLCDSCFDDKYSICENCGDFVQNDDAYYNDNGDAFCDSCFCDLYTICENCNSAILNKDIINHDDSNYCSDCFNKLFTFCDNCKDFKNADYFILINSQNICSECIDENYYYFDFLNVWSKKLIIA